jgi:hypothetical protein
VGQITVPHQDLTLVTPQPPADAGGANFARLHMEVKKLEGHCRAREHALERLSAALITLRNTNRALSEENSLLRVEVERRHVANK